MPGASLKFKSVMDRGLFLADPRSPLGPTTPDVIVKEVTDIPEGTDPEQVRALLEQTADVTWVLAEARYSFTFAELGAGRIIRE